MNIKAKHLSLLALIAFSLMILAESSRTTKKVEHFCSSDDRREMARNACDDIDSHVVKRQADLSELGYTVEKIKHYSHGHRWHKKLTHPTFPRGGYVLAPSPISDLLHISYNNKIPEYASEELSNDILTGDIAANLPRVIKKRHLKHKRNANQKPMLKSCCDTSCLNYHCY